MTSAVVLERRRLRDEAADRQRTVLRDLKDKVKRARTHKRQHLAKIRRQCLREQQKIQRDAVRARTQLRDRILRAKQAAREACKVCKANAKEEDLRKIDRALAAVQAEREAIAALRARAARLKDTRGRAGGLRRQELLRESDDAVRQNLSDPWHLQVFEKVKHTIRDSPRATRTEAFLQYLHDHPEAVWEAQKAAEEQWLREAEQEQERLVAERLTKRQLAKLSDPELDALSHSLTRAEQLAAGPTLTATAVPF